MDELAQLIAETRRAAARSRDQVVDRDDLVQETLLRVWQRLSARGETVAPKGLIRTTLARVRIDWWRKQRRMELTDVDVESRVPRPLEDAALLELRALLRKAIEALPELQRDVVRLRYDEHKSFKEIAVLQGAPLNTVLGRMHLAMKRLRLLMEKACGA